MIKCEFEDGGKGNLRHVVVHCLCINDGKILLVKRAEGILEAGKWGFPGGFLDHNEDIKACAIRELMEETGYESEVDQLFRINSGQRLNDSARHNVAFEFLMKVKDRTGKPDWEQTKVEWIDLGEIDEERMAFDHYKTILDLKKYIIESTPLPILYP